MGPPPRAVMRQERGTRWAERVSSRGVQSCRAEVNGDREVAGAGSSSLQDSVQGVLETWGQSRGWPLGCGDRGGDRAERSG